MELEAISLRGKLVRGALFLIFFPVFFRNLRFRGKSGLGEN